MATDLTDPTQNPGPGYGWDDNWGRWIWNGGPTTPPGQQNGPTTPDATPTPPSTPGPPPPPGPGGGDDLTSPFPKTWTPPPPVNLGGPAGIPYIPPTPVFNAPNFKQAPAFTAPDWSDVQNDKGYQFRKTEGGNSLKALWAAQGVLGTGGAAKDFDAYNSNLASQEYGNVFNRAAQTYNTNYQSQYVDPNAWALHTAEDAFAPQMLGYQTQAQAGQHQTDMNTANSWNDFLQSYNIFRNQQNDTFDKRYRAATA